MRERSRLNVMDKYMTMLKFVADMGKSVGNNSMLTLIAMGVATIITIVEYVRDIKLLKLNKLHRSKTLNV